MNKQTIITILLALVAMAGQAQTIKRVEASPEDFMEHMAMFTKTSLRKCLQLRATNYSTTRGHRKHPTTITKWIFCYHVVTNYGPWKSSRLAIRPTSRLTSSARNSQSASTTGILYLPRTIKRMVKRRCFLS